MARAHRRPTNAQSVGKRTHSNRVHPHQHKVSKKPKKKHHHKRPTFGELYARAAAPSLANREILLMSQDAEFVAVGLAGPDPWTPSAGGGFEAVSRPLRRGVPVWRGYDVPSLSGTIVFDGVAKNELVQREWRQIEQMAGMFVHHDDNPPKLIVIGNTVPHDYSEAPHKRWVIAQPPEFSDVMYRRGGGLVRFTVGLTLWLTDDIDELRDIKPRKKRPHFKIYHAKHGDTYEKIAAHVLGSKRLGRKLAKFNGDRDPTKHLKKGERVKLPRGDLLKEWKQEIRQGVGNHTRGDSVGGGQD
jgi:hypothetical protein